MNMIYEDSSDRRENEPIDSWTSQIFLSDPIDIRQVRKLESAIAPTLEWRVHFYQEIRSLEKSLQWAFDGCPQSPGHNSFLSWIEQAYLERYNEIILLGQKS
jgi:hypothetical protein